jgi:hypothetical protein
MLTWAHVWKQSHDGAPKSWGGYFCTERTKATQCTPRWYVLRSGQMGTTGVMMNFIKITEDFWIGEVEHFPEEARELLNGSHRYERLHEILYPQEMTGQTVLQW